MTAKCLYCGRDVWNGLDLCVYCLFKWLLGKI